MFVMKQPRRSPGGFVAAVAAHAALFVLVIALGRAGLLRGADDFARTVLPDHLTWIAGQGGGGGGGGEGQKERPRTLKRAGHDAATMPVAPATPTEPKRLADAQPDPTDRLVMPIAKPLGDALDSLTGLIDPTAVVEARTRGAGAGPGAGGGKGDGSGPGKGPGLGDGDNGNFGGGIYRDGAPGLTRPVAIYSERPRYTNDAMRARVQGVITVACIVRPNGICSDIRVVDSITPAFGLDDEARRAAALWRFKPGTAGGQPVPVAVRIQLEFTLR